MCYCEIIKRVRKSALAWSMVSLMTMLVGCASSNVTQQRNGNADGLAKQQAVSQPVMSQSDAGSADQQPSVDQAKLISNIGMEETDDSIAVSIQGNTSLTYTSVKQPLPLGLVLYFPETALGTTKSEFTINSDIIESIKAAEIIEGGPSKVTIALKKDIPYEVKREGDGLTIVFDKISDTPDFESIEKSQIDGTAAATEAPEIEEAEIETPDQSESGGGDVVLWQTEEPVGMATRLENVTTEELDESIKINIISNGSITDYKSFTLKNPARIVFDLYNISSAHKSQQTLAIDTKWVKNVRHFKHPDYIRVVLDTESEYLSSFSADSVADGLSIHVGLESLEEKREDKSTASIANIPAAVVGVAVADTQEVNDTETPEEIAPDQQGTDTTDEKQEKPVAQEAEALALAEGDQQLASVEDDQQPASTENDQRTAFSEQEEEDLEKVEAELEKDISSKGQDEFAVLEKDEEVEAIENELEEEFPSMKTGSAVFDGGEAGLAETGTEETVQIEAMESDPEVGDQEVEIVSIGAAFVNQTDFAGKEDGASTIVIGTTQPVEYSVKKFNDKGLQLTLFNTNIHKNRQRPIITTRFESAVDRITPTQTPAMNNDSMVVIELREDVPYRVEQSANQILIHVEASSIAPKPFEEADLPPWKQILEQTVVEAQAPAIVEPEEIAIVEEASETQVEEVAEAPDTEAELIEVQEVEVSEAIEEEEVVVALDETETIEMGDAEVVEIEIEDAAEVPMEEQVIDQKFKGEKISLDFYQTDIKNVLRILRDVSGKNFAIDKDVAGQVTLSLIKPVPWDQVLDLVLKMNQLSSIMEGDVVRITTVTTKLREDQLREDLRKAEQTVTAEEIAHEPLLTEYLSVSYADASMDVLPHVEKILTAERGTVSLDIRNNQLIVTDVAEKIRQAMEIVREIDKVTPQVMIEARIVEVSETFSRDIGTEWGSGSYDVAGNRFFPTDGNSYSWNVAMNHPANASTGALGFNFSRIIGTPFSINAMLKAAEVEGESKIISSPRVVTLDNKIATIKQGVEVPYQKDDGNGNTTTSFKNVDLKLDVTPHVTPDNRIALILDIEKNDVIPGGGDTPSLSTNSTKTELLVNDNDTIVIGGVVKSNKRVGEIRFPILGQLPLVGWLFKSKNRALEKTELLIFITPTIVHLEKRDS